jgi:two-component system sensor histidine kinase/response regulator
MPSTNDLRLSDIVSCQVLDAPPECTLGEAAQRMSQARISCLVVTRDRRPVGIITEHDIMRFLHGRIPPSTAIADVMSPVVITAPMDTDFRSAFILLNRHGIHHLVAVDAKGVAAGVATASDFRTHIGVDIFRNLEDIHAVIEPVLAVLPTDACLDAVLEWMVRERCEYVLATEAGKPVGILTQRDMPRLLGQSIDASRTRLADVMSAPLRTIPSDTSVGEASALMSRFKVRQLPVMDPQAGLIGVVSQARLLEILGLAIMDDLYADHEQLRQEKRDAEERLKMAFEATGLGLWEYEHGSGHVVWSRDLCALLGHAAAPDDLSAWLDLIHPDDRPGFKVGLDAAQAPDGPLFEMEYRLRHSDGLYLWFHAKGRV